MMTKRNKRLIIGGGIALVLLAVLIMRKRGGGRGNGGKTPINPTPIPVEPKDTRIVGTNKDGRQYRCYEFEKRNGVWYHIGRNCKVKDCFAEFYLDRLEGGRCVETQSY